MTRLDPGYVLGAVGLLSLCGTSYLIGTLRGGGGGIERSVQTGIEAGVDRALDSGRLEDSGRAAGRGLAVGAVDGALSTATDEQIRDRGRAAVHAALSEADQAARIGLSLLEETLGGAPRPPASRPEVEPELEPELEPGLDSEPHREPEPGAAEGSGRRSRSPLVGEVANAAEEATDLGLDLLDAMLGSPQDPQPEAAEPEAAEPEATPSE